MRLWGAVGLCALAVGCGGSSDEPAASPGDGGSGGAEAGSEAGTEDAAIEAESGGEDVAPDATGTPSVELSIVEISDLPTVLTSIDDLFALPPLEGVTLAVDAPDGTRREFTSDAQGKATVPDFGEPDDIVVITAFKAGYALASWEAPVSRIGETPLLFIQSTTPTPLVTISGTAVGMTDTANQLLVVPTTSYEKSQNAGGAFSLGVPAASPFSLVGLEFGGCSPACARCTCQSFLGWTRKDHDAITADTTVDLDFAQSLAPVHTTGTIELPEREDSRLRVIARPYFTTNSFGAVPHGFPLTTALSPDGASFTYTAEHVVWDGAPDTSTQYVLTDNVGRARSSVIVDGYPQPDAVVSGFLDTPEMTNPPGMTTSTSMQDAFAWVPRETTNARVLLYRGGTMIWSASVDSASSVKLPHLPSTADSAEVLGTDPLDAYLILMVNTNPGSAYYERSLLMWGYKVTP